MLDGFGFFQHALCRVLDMLEALTNAFVGERKNRMLGVIQNVLRFIFFFQRLSGYLVCDLDQLTQEMFSANNFGIRGDARNMRQAVSQVTEEEHASRSLEGVISTQFFPNQNVINLRATLEQSNHRHKDAPL